MAKKPFEIQNSTLIVGGVNLEAGATTIVIPGVTQATNYVVSEVYDTGNQATQWDTGLTLYVLDYAELGRLYGDSRSGTYVAAEYSAILDDDGEIDEIQIDAQGTFTSAEKSVADDDLWATQAVDPINNFNINDWVQIPFRPKFQPGEVENVGGGAANTGDVTFNGIKIIGSDVGSGSGDLELVPDNTGTYYADGQYIRIYPTRAVPDAPHIHLSAGYGGDLMLGDDQRSVDVNHDSNVYIRTDQYGGAYNWKFADNGSLVGPTLVTTGWQGWDTNTGPTLQLGDTSNGAVISPVPTDDSNRYGPAIKIRGQRGYGTWNNNSSFAGDGSDVYVYAGAGGESSTSNQGGEGGNVYIRSGLGQGGRDGGDIELYAGPAICSDANFNNSTNDVHGGYVTIISGDAIDGVAAGKGTGGSITLRSGRGNTTNGYIQFETSSDGSNWDNVWIFNDDGTTKFPTLTVPISDNANPSGTGQTIKFSDSSQQAIIYGPPADATYTSAERIILQGAPGLAGTNGEGGDIYLWAGPGGDVDGDGGDIKIRAGRGYGTGGGGYLNFQAGDAISTGSGGWINIESGSSNSVGQGGNITITANSGGQILFQTYNPGYYGNTEWYMKKDGVTRFPNNSIAGENTGLTIATKNIATYDFNTAYFETGNGLVNGLSGQNANSFTCTIRANQEGTYTVITYNPGSNWNVNDTLTILGSNLGGTSPANDLTLTIDAVGVSDEITTLTPSGIAVGRAWIFDTNGSTTLPNSLDIVPADVYLTGAPFNGNIIRQEGGYLLQVVSIGVNGAAGIGWIENTPTLGPPSGGIASISFNDTTNSTTIVSGSFDSTIHTWLFNDDGTTLIPGTINSAAGVGDVVLNASDGTIRTWTFGGDSTLTLPGIDGGVPVIDFFSAGASNHILTLSSDWTLNLKARADVANQGHLVLEAGQNTKINVNGNGSTIELVASTGVATKTWTFASDGSTTFPNGAKLNDGTALQFATDNTVVTSLDLRDTNGGGFYTNNDGYTIRSNGTYNWVFGTSGRTQFPTTTAPAHSYGAAGDKAGMVAFDNSYIYYCTANYVNNTTDIWKRVALDATPW